MQIFMYMHMCLCVCFDLCISNKNYSNEGADMRGAQKRRNKAEVQKLSEVGNTRDVMFSLPLSFALPCCLVALTLLCSVRYLARKSNVESRWG